MMKTKGGSKTSWFWPFQISVGTVCLILAAIVVGYGATTTAGAYIWLFLAGVGLMILGAERLASGIFSKAVKKSSRAINIAIGAGLIIYIGSGFFFPQFATKYLLIFLAFALLANGAIRIFSGLKKKDQESYNIHSIVIGALIVILSLMVLAFPKFGLGLLLIITAIALAMSGIQIIIAGIKGRRQKAALSEARIENLPSSTPSEIDQESSSIPRKGIW